MQKLYIGLNFAGTNKLFVVRFILSSYHCCVYGSVVRISSNMSSSFFCFFFKLCFKIFSFHIYFFHFFFCILTKLAVHKGAQYMRVCYEKQQTRTTRWTKYSDTFVYGVAAWLSGSALASVSTGIGDRTVCIR